MAEPACPPNLPPLSIGTRACPPNLPHLSIGTSATVAISSPTSSSPGGAGVELGDADVLTQRSPRVGLFSTIKEDEAWDEGIDEINIGQTRKALNCTRGASGVVALGMSADFATTVGDGLALTMSAEATVSGSSSGFKWVRGDTIGRGTMGIVFQGLMQDTGQVIAVKEVMINQSDASDVKFREQLANEIEICKDLKHARIVQYLGHDEIDGNLFIYMEHMVGGSMAGVLSQFGAFEESLIQVYTKELLEGLAYLHSRSPPVVHRDIKSANVLVGLDTRVKLADFGCSKRTADTMNRTMKGSIPWMAPEVITSTGYGRRADIWSLGCVVIEMATASTPWGKFDNPMAAMLKIGMSKEIPKIPDFLSEDCQSLIKLCIQRDLKKRPYAENLLKHDFVADLLTDDF